MACCLLLTLLPPELRLHIYKYLLRSEGTVRPKTSSPAEYKSKAAILVTCRQIYDEAYPILLSINTWVIDPIDDLYSIEVFAEAAVGVLHLFEPSCGGGDEGWYGGVVRGLVDEAADHVADAVDVVRAPASVPRSAGLLGPGGVVYAAEAGKVGLLQELVGGTGFAEDLEEEAEGFEDSTGYVGGGGVEEGVHVWEGDLV